MSNRKIAVIGLGYVGLPLAVEFGKIRRTVGFDINNSRIGALNDGVDHTLEITSEELDSSKHLSFTCNIRDIEDCSIYIIMYNSCKIELIYYFSQNLASLRACVPGIFEIKKI